MESRGGDFRNVTKPGGVEGDQQRWWRARPHLTLACCKGDTEIEPLEKRIRFGSVSHEQVRLSSEGVNYERYVCYGKLWGPDVRAWSKVVLSMLLLACAESPRLQLRAPDPPPQVLTQECGGLRVRLTLDRRRQSALITDVFVTDAADQMLSDISRVVLAFIRKTQANTTTTLVASLREAGHYVPTSEFPLTPDPWTVGVIVRRANGIAVSCLFSFDL